MEHCTAIFGYNTDNPANSIMTDDDKNMDMVSSIHIQESWLVRQCFRNKLLWSSLVLESDTLRNYFEFQDDIVLIIIHFM
ncbi:MAG: hypothetical protein ACLS9K_03760 [Lachnospira eligens]